MLTDLSMKANKHEDDADTCPDGFSRIAQGVDRYKNLFKYL